MKVKWLKGHAHVERQIKEYVWNEENGFSQDVDDHILVDELRKDGSFLVLDEKETVCEDPGEEEPEAIEEE